MVRNEALSITRRELLAARDRYRELFDDAPNPVLVLSEDGVVLEANRAAEAQRAAEANLASEAMLAIVFPKPLTGSTDTPHRRS